MKPCVFILALTTLLSSASSFANCVPGTFQNNDQEISVGTKIRLAQDIEFKNGESAEPSYIEHSAIWGSETHYGVALALDDKSSGTIPKGTILTYIGNRFDWNHHQYRYVTSSGRVVNFQGLSHASHEYGLWDLATKFKVIDAICRPDTKNILD